MMWKVTFRNPLRTKVENSAHTHLHQHCGVLIRWWDGGGEDDRQHLQNIISLSFWTLFIPKTIKWLIDTVGLWSQFCQLFKEEKNFLTAWRSRACSSCTDSRLHPWNLRRPTSHWSFLREAASACMLLGGWRHTWQRKRERGSPKCIQKEFNRSVKHVRPHLCMREQGSIQLLHSLSQQFLQSSRSEQPAQCQKQASAGGTPCLSSSILPQPQPLSVVASLPQANSHRLLKLWGGKKPIGYYQYHDHGQSINKLFPRRCVNTNKPPLCCLWSPGATNPTTWRMLLRRFQSCSSWERR